MAAASAAPSGALPAHMTMHLVLLELAPVLLLAGAGARGLARIHVSPVVAAISSTAILLAWHVPAVFDAALRSPPLHLAEHAFLLLAGLLLWLPLFSPRTGTVAALVFLFVTRNVQMVLGNVLLWLPHRLYEGSGTLHDQRVAAAVMLGEGAVAGILAAAWLVARLVREQPSPRAALAQPGSAVGAGR